MSVAAKKLAEKHKEELRKLVSHEANRNCFDCGVRGPLYVVLDFHIFVCSSCSAIHRSFQHRVKGITMSDFSSEEVSAISAGGNGKAAACWHGRGFLAVPHSSDERAIKESIRVVFQEKRYHDSSAWQAWQQEVVAASLPPVTVLTSIAEIGPLQPPTPLSRRDAPTATAQQQQQHATTTSAGKASVFSASGPQQQQPPLAPATTTTAAAVAPPQAASNKSSTNDPFSFFDSQPIAAASPPPQHQQQPQQQQGAAAATTTTASAGVDDFFSSRPSAAPVGPTTTATTPQQQRLKVDDLFAAVPPTTTNTTTNTMTAAPPLAASTRHDDFFSVPSASSTPPYQQQQHVSTAPNFNSNAHFGSSAGTIATSSSSSSSAGATMDFFAPTNAWQATTAPATTSSYSSQPLPQHQNKNDFFYDHSQPVHSSASSSSVPRQPAPSNNDPFGAFAAPQPSAVPVAGSTATASHDVNFFADLNPFGKK